MKMVRGLKHAIDPIESFDTSVWQVVHIMDAGRRGVGDENVEKSTKAQVIDQQLRNE